MNDYRARSGARILLQAGDLTEVEVDALVNAANERMLGGGGVDGAIHRAAGPELLAACRAVAEGRPGVRCPTGEARLTPGFRLRARHVIHTVGPVYARHPDPPAALASAYRACLELAREHGILSIAFPAISCGVYGYPAEEAARISLGIASEETSSAMDVRFVLFDPDVRRAYEAVAAELLTPL